jgi:cell division inhibitor SulA
VNLLKKKKEIDILQVDNYIDNEIFKSGKENVFNSIYSGLCYNKENKLSLSFNLSGHKKSEDLSELKSKTDKKNSFNNKSRCALSSGNLIQIEETDLSKISRKKSNTIELKPTDSPNSANSEIKKGNLSNNDDDSELELYFDEGTPSSESFTNTNTLIESEKNGNNAQKKLLLSPPPQIQRSVLRMKTLNSSKLLDLKYLNNNETIFKKERSMSFYTASSKGNHSLINDNDKIIPFINFFDEPDECYLKNAKKELMMNVFSYFFLISFFIVINLSK